MPSVTMRREYPDHDIVSVTVHFDHSYPDALDQARVTCREAFHDAMGITEATWKKPTEEPPE